MASLAQPFNRVDIELLRNCAFQPELPLQLRGDTAGCALKSFPAAEKWFSADSSEISDFSGYFRRLVSLSIATYELVETRSGGVGDGVAKFQAWLIREDEEIARIFSRVIRHGNEDDGLPSDDVREGFHRFDAPWGLVMLASKYNSTVDHDSRLKSLYIAQTPLDSLPPTLQSDLPVPQLIKSVGKGDIYASSMWVGLEPTYTPLHRDPNPNLFVQLKGTKEIRILPPFAGRVLYRSVLESIGQGGNPNLRGMEMMQGPELLPLRDAIWGAKAKESSEILKAEVSEGDALFIPKGWWHSVRSLKDAGRLNVSINWWFR